LLCLVHLAAVPAMAAQSEDHELGDCAMAVCQESPSTLFIFDWDDTILPTTALSLQGFSLDGPEVDMNSDFGAALVAHTQAWVETLGQARHYGKVMVVTAAEQGWVEATCSKFLPGLASQVMGAEAWVSVVSARSVFEPKGYSDPLEWKQMAFAAAVEQYFPESCKHRNVVSVGDASYERRAILSLANWVPYCTPKSLKFLERPSLPALSRECEFVRMWLKRLSTHPGSLDLCVHQNPDPGEQAAPELSEAPAEPRPHFDSGDAIAQTVVA